MKGIILAGGSGTRLYPNTITTSKQLLPVYDKPMIYYPLSTLMLAGIKDILLITTERDKGSFETLLGDGSKLGVSISYKIQDNPNGLAEAFIIGEEFINGEPVALILGDNIFYGNSMSTLLRGFTNPDGAVIFGYHVSDPSRYGVVNLDKDLKPVALEEKPVKPKSNYAVPGLYFYDSRVVDYAKRVKPSERGELEITDINQMYLDDGALHVGLFKRGTAWLDTGTLDSMLDASNYVRTIQEMEGLSIGSPEEVAWQMGYISSDQLRELAEPIKKSGYGTYLLKVLDNPELKEKAEARV